MDDSINGWGMWRVRHVRYVMLYLLLPLFYYSTPPSLCGMSILPKVRCQGRGSAFWSWVFRGAGE